MILITILVIIVCTLLLLIVLIQNPKGGLDSAFSSNNQVMGVRKTADFLEKATWTMGIALVVLSIASSAVNPTKNVASEEDKETKMQYQIDNATLPGAQTLGNGATGVGAQNPSDAVEQSSSEEQSKKD